MKVITEYIKGGEKELIRIVGHRTVRWRLEQVPNIYIFHAHGNKKYQLHFLQLAARINEKIVF